MLEEPFAIKNREVLRKFADRIDWDELVILRGHTDPTGPATVNLDLAEKRAENVRDVFYEHFRKTPTRLSSMPIGAQTSEQFWSQQNTGPPWVNESDLRRVDLYHCSASENSADGHGP